MCRCLCTEKGKLCRVKGVLKQIIRLKSTYYYEGSLNVTLLYNSKDIKWTTFMNLEEMFLNVSTNFDTTLLIFNHLIIFIEICHYKFAKDK